MSNHHKFANSSSIAHIDYHDDKGCLEIKFTSGQTYHYPGCPKDHYHALKQAASPGSYFHKSIKSRYDGVKL